MNVENILSRLEGVKSIGQGKWKARCCAHPDRSPSLYITEKPESILMHCFSGCDINAILDALGMSIDDLFPERTRHNTPHTRPQDVARFPYAEVMRAISHEALVAAIGATAAASGPITETDRARIVLAADRIRSALNAAGMA